jgi:peptidoglycan/xylan/chitin deacetylase (PgdA/CDA1 family)
MIINRREFLGLSAGIGAGLLIGFDRLYAAPKETFPVFLTFDAGFATNQELKGATVEVLDILKESETPATFFPNGRNLNNWEGAILARIMLDGHALGNRLWQETGNLVDDNPATTLLAEQFLKAERKIRQLIQSTNQNAADLYRKQVRLYRRPGGDTKLAPFLVPDKFEELTREPFLKPFVDSIEWMKEVYDYSGWHIGVPKNPFSSYGMTQQVMRGSKDGQGLAPFLCVKETKTRAAQLADGLIIQMRDGDKITPDALPQIILQLKNRGAEFKVLPRAADKPNTFTVAVDELPLSDPDGAACLP